MCLHVIAAVAGCNYRHHYRCCCHYCHHYRCCRCCLAGGVVGALHVLVYVGARGDLGPVGAGCVAGGVDSNPCVRWGGIGSEIAAH